LDGANWRKTLENVPACTKGAEDPLRQKVTPAEVKRKIHSLKMQERSLNVYENKGTLWKTGERSLNVVDNKRNTSIKRECY
jgi:hypothetical protein